MARRHFHRKPLIFTTILQILFRCASISLDITSQLASVELLDYHRSSTLLFIESRIFFYLLAITLIGCKNTSRTSRIRLSPIIGLRMIILFLLCLYYILFGMACMRKYEKVTKTLEIMLPCKYYFS